MSSLRYFARWGKVFGPYEESEVTQMQGDGKLADFSWVWDAAAGAWKPLDPSPPPLTKGKEKTPAAMPPSIEAVCHNHGEYLSGQLDKVTETGCEFESWHPEVYPTFGLKAVVRLSLLNVDTGEVRNLSAQVCGVDRSQGKWRYRMRWDSKPEFGVAKLHQNFS